MKLHEGAKFHYCISDGFWETATSGVNTLEEDAVASSLIDYCADRVHMQILYITYSGGQK